MQKCFTSNQWSHLITGAISRTHSEEGYLNFQAKPIISFSIIKLFSNRVLVVEECENDGRGEIYLSKLEGCHDSHDSYLRR